MTRGLWIALRARPSLRWALVLLAAGVAASLALHLRPTSQPAVAPVVDVGCVEDVEIARLPDATIPDARVYDRAETCLRDAEWTSHHVDVAQIRNWIEVEHDPAWFDPTKATWWLPLSGEGEEHFASGPYISVPMSGAACGFAIIN